MGASKVSTQPANQLPNDYTGCEVYRGFVIGLRNDWYKGFRGGEPMIGIGPERTRAAVRKAIDQVEASK
jgi:hypothetical protein